MTASSYRRDLGIAPGAPQGAPVIRLRRGSTRRVGIVLTRSGLDTDGAPLVVPLDLTGWTGLRFVIRGSDPDSPPRWEAPPEALAIIGDGSDTVMVTFPGETTAAWDWHTARWALDGDTPGLEPVLLAAGSLQVHQGAWL